MPASFRPRQIGLIGMQWNTVEPLKQAPTHLEITADPITAADRTSDVTPVSLSKEDYNLAMIAPLGGMDRAADVTLDAGE